MKDLTQGPIPRHIVQMAVPIAFGMLLQTLYYFVDSTSSRGWATPRSRA